MRMIVIFEDTPVMPAVRQKLGAAHGEFLRKNQTEIVLAGGLREQPEAGYVGGLWVLEVVSRERAIELIEADPFFAVEKRPYRLLNWGKAFPELQVVL